MNSISCQPARGRILQHMTTASEICTMSELRNRISAGSQSWGVQIQPKSGCRRTRARVPKVPSIKTCRTVCILHKTRHKIQENYRKQDITLHNWLNKCSVVFRFWTFSEANLTFPNTANQINLLDHFMILALNTRHHKTISHLFERLQKN